MSSRQNSRFDKGDDDSTYYRRNSSQRHSSSQSQSQSQYQRHPGHNQTNYYDDSSTSRQQTSNQMPTYPVPNPSYQNQMTYERPSYQAPYNSYQQVPQQYSPAQMKYDPRMACGGQGYYQPYSNPQPQQQYWTQNQSTAPAPTPVPNPIGVEVPRKSSTKPEATSAPDPTSKRSSDDSRDGVKTGSSLQRVSTGGGCSQAKKEEEKEIKKAAPIMVGKRRGGRVLPTGVVKKQRPDTTSEGRTDAWGQYMAEVQKYKAQSCEEERKNRPLVK